MFIVILTAVLGLMHLYLWKRLIRDTTRPGLVRWVLTADLVICALLLVAALVVPRTFGVTSLGWLAWPGYVWFGVAQRQPPVPPSPPNPPEPPRRRRR
jgi:hypothetical protein